MSKASDLPLQWCGTTAVASLAADGSTTFELSPNTKKMRSDRLVVDGSTLVGLMVTSIKIGDNEYITGGGVIPAKMLAHDAVGCAVRLPASFDNRTPLKVTVRNDSAAAITDISVGALGPVVER